MEATLSTTDTVRSSARKVALALRESLESPKQSRADQGATTP
jgi:hypothetical protein